MFIEIRKYSRFSRFMVTLTSYDKLQLLDDQTDMPVMGINYSKSSLTTITFSIT